MTTRSLAAALGALLFLALAASPAAAVGYEAAKAGPAPDIPSLGCGAQFNPNYRITPYDVATTLYQEGNTCIGVKNYALAIIYYTESIEQNPLNVVYAYRNRGIAYEAEHRVNLAIADLTRAVALVPEDPENYYQRGLAYMLKNGYNHAIADFTQAITLMPESSNGYLERGMAYSKTGQYVLALADETKALGLNPAEIDAYMERARVYEMTGDKDKALADYHAALGINPQYPRALEGVKRLTASR